VGKVEAPPKTVLPMDIRLALRESAYDFLNVSIDEAGLAEEEPRRWKFAIVHIAQTLELLLKARLAQEHELLVRANVGKAGRLTVGFNQALERLAHCGVHFDQADLRRLESARNLRNDVVHFATMAEPEELRAAYIDLFEFAHVFHLKELHEELHEHVAEEAWAAEAHFMEAFRSDTTTYQGVEIRPPFAAEIVAAQYEPQILVNGQPLDRIRYRDEREHFMKDFDGNCGDCAVRPGQLHVPGCDWETCPHCGRQLISCDSNWSFGETEDSSSSAS
jgi:hypothetical protein